MDPSSGPGPRGARGGSLARWTGALRGRPLGLLAWLAFVVAWLVWTPWGPFGGSSRLDLAPPTGLLEIGLNLLLMAPLAVAVAVTGRHGTTRRRLLEAAGVAFAFSVVVEIVQGLVPALGRVASPYDVLLNTTGGAAAAGLAVAAVRLAGARRRVLLVAAAAASFAGAGLYMAGSAARSARGLAIERWDPSYRVLAGDEVGGGRRYLGTVTDARICAGPEDREVCAEPAAGPELRTRLVAAAETSDRVRLDATVVSASDAQEGPARIVTFSTSILDRNATLGQQGRSLVLRVRTPRLGMNGASIEFVLPNAVRMGTPTRVKATFVRGRVSLSASSAEGTKSGSFPTGLLPSWWYVRPGLRKRGSVTPRYLLVASALGAGVLFTPIGYVLAGVGSGLAVPLGLAVVVPVLLLLAVNAGLGSATSGFGVLFVLAASVTGLLLHRADIGLGAGRRGGSPGSS